jgi:hypothetical protein
LQDALANRRDAEISAALRAAPSHAAYLNLWHAVCDVAHQIDSAAPKVARSSRACSRCRVIITGSARPAGLLELSQISPRSKRCSSGTLHSARAQFQRAMRCARAKRWKR